MRFLLILPVLFLSPRLSFIFFQALPSGISVFGYILFGLHAVTGSAY